MLKCDCRARSFRDAGNFGGVQATIAEGGGRTRPARALMHALPVMTIDTALRKGEEHIREHGDYSCVSCKRLYCYANTIPSAHQNTFLVHQRSSNNGNMHQLCGQNIHHRYSRRTVSALGMSYLPIYIKSRFDLTNNKRSTSLSISPQRMRQWHRTPTSTAKTMMIPCLTSYPCTILPRQPSSVAPYQSSRS